jgi:hypothetical protein
VGRASPWRTLLIAVRGVGLRSADRDLDGSGLTGIDPLDLLRAVVGVSQGGAGDDWVANAKKVAAILVAGIRARPSPAKGKAGR